MSQHLYKPVILYFSCAKVYSDLLLAGLKKNSLKTVTTNAIFKKKQRFLLICKETAVF